MCAWFLFVYTWAICCGNYGCLMGRLVIWWFSMFHTFVRCIIDSFWFAAYTQVTCREDSGVYVAMLCSCYKCWLPCSYVQWFFLDDLLWPMGILVVASVFVRCKHIRWHAVMTLGVYCKCCVHVASVFCVAASVVFLCCVCVNIFISDLLRTMGICCIEKIFLLHRYILNVMMYFYVLTYHAKKLLQWCCKRVKMVCSGSSYCRLQTF